MKKAIVVGSGAGGATAAKELQGKFGVTVLEAGKVFRPFSMRLSTAEKFKKAGLMIDEREIRLLFPAMQVRKIHGRMVLVNGIGLGGTTTLSAGNAVRADDDLKKCGINLDAEFAELYREIPVHTDHQKRWRITTRRLYEICREMDLKPEPLQKMGNSEKCTYCGRCVLGCAYGAKWDSRRFLNVAIDKGADLVTGCRVEQVVFRDGRAVGVKARRGWTTEFHPADLVVLAAGGFGTPVILQNSGIECEKRLFVDPVLCVAAEWKGCMQNKEISMPFVVQKNGYIISPYFDFLSYFFNKKWKHPVEDTLGIMIKIADSNNGGASKRSIEKMLTDADKEKLKEGVAVCREMLARLGVNEQDTFLGILNAGHPGGMLPLTANEAETFHHQRLAENLYIADATLFPASLGKPPIFTIMAMAKRVAKLCSQTI
jgi:choline dehydrogenase-like flavoprotein